MEDLRVSQWMFDTSAGASFGIGAMALSGGMISLKGLGAGVGLSAALTKISVPETVARNYDLTGSGSFSSFYSAGKVYMTNSFKGNELTLADLKGPALYVESGLALVTTAGLTVMFLGLAPTLLEAAVMLPMFSSGLIDLAIRDARAILLMGGQGMGPQVGIGISGLVGMVH
jgi:hypothetical protein